MKGFNNVIASHGNSVAQKFGYNGKELEESLGLNLMEMDMRQFDPTIARWTSIDPVTHHSQSTYNGFDNNPIYWADPSGADGEIKDHFAGSGRPYDPARDKTFANMTGAITANSGPGDPPTTIYNGTGTAVGDNVSNLLDEVVIGGSTGGIQSGGYSTEIGPYEWGGTTADYYARYGNSYDPAAFGAYVNVMSQLEKNRRNVQKLKSFVDRFSMLASVTAFSFGAPNLAISRGFNLRFSNSSSNNWIKLSNLDDIEGVVGIYKFPHANRGMKIYTGQSNNIAVRLKAHYKSGSIGGDIHYQPMSGSTRLVREIAETRHIISIVKGNISNSANIRYPVSFARAKKLGLNLYK